MNPTHPTPPRKIKVEIGDNFGCILFIIVLLTAACVFKWIDRNKPHPQPMLQMQIKTERKNDEPRPN